MTPLPTPTKRTWLKENYKHYTNNQLCIMMIVGQKQMKMWVKNMGLNRKKIKKSEKAFIKQN
jgi:hypothetical protein